MKELCLVTNGFELRFDPHTGKPVSLARRGATTWEFLSPSNPSSGLWELEARASDGQTSFILSPGDRRVRLTRIESDPERLQFTYHVFLQENEKPALSITATLQIADQIANEGAELTQEIRGTIAVSNSSPGWCVTSVVYPLLHGIRARAAIPALPQEPHSLVSPTPVRETLVYPFFAGLRFDDPVRSLTSPFPGPAGLGVISARPVAGNPGLFRLQELYCGQLSMAWMDYFAHADAGADPEAAGLYLASYDPEGRIVALRVDVEQGDGLATLALGVVHPVRVAAGESLTCGPVALAAHGGDWHWGARRYRAFARQVLRPQSEGPAAVSGQAAQTTVTGAATASPATGTSSQNLPLPSRRPEWLEHSDSLMAHYDFKWQDGSFTHTFADLYPLYQRAEADGVGHLFVAGWSSGGFDHLYPEYYPDLSLGTVMDFVDGVRQIRKSGGQVTFYINAALFGTDSHYHPTLGEQWAVRKEDGTTEQRHFFDKDFTVNCRGAAGYQRQIIDTVRWLVGEAGASGVYLDCYAAIGPLPCFSPEHGHLHPFTWNADARRLLEQLNDTLTRHRLNPFLMIEGCGDRYAPYLSAGLIHGWYYAYSYPEMYKYTFPEFLMVDMVYPAHGQRFRAQGISDLAYDQLHRTLILGSIFWFYDQEDARFCNFRTDPEMWEYIRELLKLRAMVRPFLQHGEFLDDEGVEVILPEKEGEATGEGAEGAGTGEAQSAGAIWRPYRGQPVVVKRFRLRQPAPATEAGAELPVSCGTLLVVWRRGSDELAPPKTPAEVEAAANSLGSGEGKGWLRLAGISPNRQQPGNGQPAAWLLAPGKKQFQPWPAQWQSTGNGRDRDVLELPLPATPIAMILVAEE
ncbi:MAG: hypothetical protein IMX00_10055 [Limnochordales bacterium]|nr:hypothetical protein [Limnochordales bacterium]